MRTPMRPPGPAKTVEPAALDRAAAILLEVYKRGAPAFSCGNGGSAAIANHLQCDHMKGVRTATDWPPACTASARTSSCLRDRQ